METGDFRTDVDGAIAAGDAAGAARMLAAPWEADPGPAMAGFVASRFHRIGARLDLAPRRCAIPRSFTVEPLMPILKAGAYAGGIALETALLAHLAADARERGANELRGWFLPTRKNAPAREFYRDRGFEVAEQTAGGTLWKLDLRVTKIRTPEWNKQVIAADERR
jgi:GNAT superfamily N-acetyltransferase